MNYLKMFTNSLMRRLPEYMQGGGDTKHCDKDYGYPENLFFRDFYDMYKRNGIARAVVQKPVQRTWHDHPWLLTDSEPHDETPYEAQIREAFDRLMFWTKLSQVDEYSRVGEYGAVILRFADNRSMDQPVNRVPGGLDGLVEIIPVFEEQLVASEFDTDPMSSAYGRPVMYNFNEAAVDADANKLRSFNVHPDRVHIWTADGSINGESELESIYNALIDLNKIRGAGGEGFWKSAKNAPVFESSEGVDMQQLAAGSGFSSVEEYVEAFDDQVDGYNRGMDASLITQGFKVQYPNITLPSPEHFWQTSLQEVVAAKNIPQKILVGNQNGERASTEDGKEWDSTIMARRANFVKPNLMRLFRHLVDVGILRNMDYHLDWDDLTEDSADDKRQGAKTMADIVKALMATGAADTFTRDEIREVAGYEAIEGGAMDDGADPEEDGDVEPASNRKGRWVVNVYRK